jgi:protein-tyrosine phosphatase
MTERPGRVFRILVVCTGNQCRSPAMERLLGQLLVTSGSAPFDLDSAGTDAPAGQPIHPDTADALTRRGIATTEHRSRPLQLPQVSRADLVLVAERQHRGAVLHADGTARNRTFTIDEFEQLAAAAAGYEPAGPWELVAAADAQRHSPDGAPHPACDIADPVNTGSSGHEATVARLQRAASTISASLLASLSVRSSEGPGRGRHQKEHA